MHAPTSRHSLALVLALVGCTDAGDAGGDAPTSNIQCPEEAEVCGYRDGGWDAFCEAGVVSVRSYNTTLYCAPEISNEILCESEPPPLALVHTCASAACATSDTVYLETVDEYNRFVPMTLCQ